MGVLPDIVGVQDDVAGLRLAQRIRLDDACGALALDVAVVEFDQEPVGGGKADNLDMRLSCGRDRQAQRALAQNSFTLPAHIRRRHDRRLTASEPVEELRQTIPEGFPGWQRGQLMLQHVRPGACEGFPVRLQRHERRQVDTLMLAFLFQDIDHDGRRWARLLISEQVDDVIEIARPRAFGERSRLLCKDFFVSVGPRGEAALWRIRVRMIDGDLDRRQHEALVGGEIELDPRPAAAAR